MHTKTCAFCEKRFNKSSEYSYKVWAAIKYCSFKCYTTSRRGHTKQPSDKWHKSMKAVWRKNKGRLLGKKHPNWNGGRRISTQGYIYIYSPIHPNKDARNCVAEHRLIMEAHLGRYLRTDELVHHINENKIDNRIENLTLTTRQEHPKIHFKK